LNSSVIRRLKLKEIQWQLAEHLKPVRQTCDVAG
jgi:hypothetical protein